MDVERCVNHQTRDLVQIARHLPSACSASPREHWLRGSNVPEGGGRPSTEHQLATAMHSISTRAPRARAVAPKALPAGLLPGKNVRYTSFIAGHSFMSAIITMHFTTRSIELP